MGMNSETATVPTIRPMTDSRIGSMMRLSEASTSAFYSLSQPATKSSESVSLPDY